MTCEERRCWPSGTRVIVVFGPYSGHRGELLEALSSDGQRVAVRITVDGGVVGRIYPLGYELDIDRGAEGATP